MYEKLSKQTRVIFLYEQQERKCYYCRRPFFQDGKILKYDIDHKLPQSRGGKDTDENICLSCVYCNRAKANMTEEEFEEVRMNVAVGKITYKDMADFGLYLRLKGRFEPKTTHSPNLGHFEAPTPIPAPFPKYPEPLIIQEKENEEENF